MPSRNTAADACLARAGWQSIIFTARPQRIDLLELKRSWPCRPLRIRVHRNQAFEFVGSVLNTFLAYAGYEGVLLYGPYDDSLQFSSLSDCADVELLWLDFERYRDRREDEALTAWLSDRLLALRAHTDAPILVTNCPMPAAWATDLNRRLASIVAAVAGTHVADLAEIAAQVGDAFFDRRGLAGTPLSDLACLHAARLLGLRWIPAVVGLRIKAIAVDLDNTLYRGVIGEDGADGVELTPEHGTVQQQLLFARSRGIFLCAVSRNTPEDVDRLYHLHPEFPLRLEHFSRTMISWEPKPDSLRNLGAQLSISDDAILFIDDNPGELAAAAAELSGLTCLHAADPAELTRALELYPGLYRPNRDGTDAVRVADLAAAAARADLASHAADPVEYLRSLTVTLEFQLNPETEIHRLHELSIKTNQFNTGLLRLSEAEIARRLGDPSYRTVTAALKDRLSNAGVIAAIFAKLLESMIFVEEIAISCRALGRSVEDLLIMEPLLRIAAGRDITDIVFAFAPGPRNEPAQQWLRRHNGSTDTSGHYRLRWNPETIAARLAILPVTTIWKA